MDTAGIVGVMADHTYGKFQKSKQMINFLLPRRAVNHEDPSNKNDIKYCSIPEAQSPPHVCISECLCKV